jgi:hypothetical protein
MLARIARDGHVYTPTADPALLAKTRGQLNFKFIGVNEASTFTGFCAFHDNGTFEPLEKLPFLATAEQCFLLAYRPICREAFIRRDRPEVARILKQTDKGRPASQQAVIQTSLAAFEVGSDLGLRDLEFHKSAYDRRVVQKSYSDVRYLVLELANTPDILCSGLFYPECDFEGNQLQNLDSERTLDLLTYSIVTTEQGGAVVFAWGRESDTACQIFIRSLVAMTEDLMPHAVVRLLFSFCENMYISPQWWDGLDQEWREDLRKRLESSASLDAPPSVGCLLDNGIRAVSWSIVSKRASLG